MLYTEWNMDDALMVAREEGREEERKKTQEEDRQIFLEMLDQGLSVEEIKQRLMGND